jgi:hypothetical protein
MLVLLGEMRKRLSHCALFALPALVTLGCGGATDRRLDSEAELTVLPVSPPSPVRAPAHVAAAPERWSIVSIRANERFGFMREGGVLALSLLDGAEIALDASTVTIFMRGRELADGILTLDGARSRIVLEEPGTSWLEGELTDEAAGKRELARDGTPISAQPAAR